MLKSSLKKAFVNVENTKVLNKINEWKTFW